MEPRNYLANAGVNPPPVPGASSTGYPQAAVPGVNDDTVPGPHWFYKIGESLRKLIVGSGQVPSDADLDMVAKSVSVYGHGAGCYADTGVANAYEINPTIGTMHAVPEPFQGMPIRFIPANSNGVGASTIKYGTIVPSYPFVTKGGNAIPEKAIKAGEMVEAYFDTTVGGFVATKLHLPSALVSNVTPQSVPNSTNTKKTFDTVVDPDSLWDVANNEFVIPGAAIIAVSASNSFVVNGTGFREISCRLNGLFFTGCPRNRTPGLVADSDQMVSGRMAVAAADALAVFMYQSSGGALNTYGSAALESMRMEVIEWL